MAAALFATAFFSQRVDLGLVQAFAPPNQLGVRLAASPAWVAGSFAVALLGMVAARAVRRWRDASAFVLAGTTLLLMGAAVFTFWAASTYSCSPFGDVLCCPYAVPIR